MKFIILDAGSVSIRLTVLYEKENRLYRRYEKHKGHPLPVVFDLLKKIIQIGGL
jgi:hypothetical protein